jgi:hypothetical protein
MVGCSDTSNSPDASNADACSPLAEVCDGLDNDCDGAVDEDFSLSDEVANCGTCGNTCTSVNATPACCEGSCCISSCDAGFANLDDDMTDCEYACPVSPPAGETCNGVDDDCDGQVDEDFVLNEACDNGELGVCLETGTTICSDDGLSIQCSAPTGAPNEEETCNNLDDDCNGIVDDNIGPPVGNSCDLVPDCTIIVCESGTLKCGGPPEVCDGLDNDCDFIIDEEPMEETGGDCTDSGYEAVGDTGECAFGTTLCSTGTLQCDGYVHPSPEVCDGLDNDCDGVSDNGFNLSIDPANCGACGNACSRAHASATCMNSTCNFSCLPNYYDLNLDLFSTPSDGCEYGPCTPSGSEICDYLDNDCDGSTDEGFMQPCS